MPCSNKDATSNKCIATSNKCNLCGGFGGVVHHGAQLGLQPDWRTTRASNQLTNPLKALATPKSVNTVHYFCKHYSLSLSLPFDKLPSRGLSISQVFYTRSQISKESDHPKCTNDVPLHLLPLLRGLSSGTTYHIVRIYRSGRILATRDTNLRMNETHCTLLEASNRSRQVGTDTVLVSTCQHS